MYISSFYDMESRIQPQGQCRVPSFNPSIPMANSAKSTGPSPVATKLIVVVAVIEALEAHQSKLEMHQSEFKASLRKSLQYLQLKIDVQNKTIQEQMAQIKFLEEVLHLKLEIDKGDEEIQGMSGYGDILSEDPGLGTEGGDEEMGEDEDAINVEGRPVVKAL